MVDVGANDGGFAQELRGSVGFSGRIASAEPSPIAFARLKSAAAHDSSWEVHCVAFGSEMTIMPLTVYASDDFSSFSPLTDSARERFDIGTGQIVDVTVSTLDAWWDHLTRGSTSVLLKSDTQGHDVEVLLGLGARRPQVIVVELSMIPVYEGTPTATDTLDLLRELGYACTGMFPVSRDQDRMSVIEFDATFVRRAGQGGEQR